MRRRIEIMSGSYSDLSKIGIVGCVLDLVSVDAVSVVENACQISIGCGQDKQRIAPHCLIKEATAMVGR